MSDCATNAVQCLDSLYRRELKQEGFIPLHEPSFEGNEWTYVKDCLDSGWVSSVGKYVSDFEKKVAEICGTKYAIATVNGTAAIHAALIGVGVQAGDAVICPALTFIATANSISYCGAVPLFADSEDITFGLDAQKLTDFFQKECTQSPAGLIHRQSGRRIGAIVVVHIFGHPVQMDEMVALAFEFDIPLVEDAAESIGSRYKDRSCGSLSKVGAISFNGNKTLTTGGGGMIVTNDEELAKRMQHLTTTARTGSGWEFDHDEIGFNYRLPNLNAAMGCAQIEMLPEFLNRKRQLANRYGELFADVQDVHFVAEENWAYSNYWLCTLRLPDLKARNSFLAQCQDHDIMARPCWRLLPETNAYKGALTTGGLPVARQLEQILVNIPSSPNLGKIISKMGQGND